MDSPEAIRVKVPGSLKKNVKIGITLFLFIRGLSCPSSIQASFSLNCLKLYLTIPGFPHNCLLVSCGDKFVGF
jgi:hypothetical protein